MTPQELKALLQDVSKGKVNTDNAYTSLLNVLREAPYKDLEFARIDQHRSIRQGFPEVIFGLGKTPEQIVAIAEKIIDAGQELLITRVNEATYKAVCTIAPNALFHREANLISLSISNKPSGHGAVMVVTAGTSDVSVAEEAAVSAEVMGNRVDRLYDVGVAGLHRILAETKRLSTAKVIIVVAGMEGALPSVVAGLVDVPVIAVPTSVGYGASFGGVTALLSMLNSCAMGVSVVNIDNGFGAASSASLINHLDKT
jgi:NCAIR mutase (PurE)-related protein